MVLGKVSPIPFRALFMASLFMPASAIEGAAVVLLEAASDDAAASGGGQMVFDPKQGKLVPVAPKALVFEAPPSASAPPRDETEEEEIEKGKESDVQRMRGESDSLSGGAAKARDAWEYPSLALSINTSPLRWRWARWRTAWAGPHKAASSILAVSWAANKQKRGSNFKQVRLPFKRVE